MMVLKQPLFEAQCHCGNVTLTAKKMVASVTSCNCSICQRLGALWAYYTADQVEIDVGNIPLKSYSWGKKTIDFHHCSQCGCTTHYTTSRSSGEQLVAINARLAPLEVIENIPVRLFDGAVTWKYLNEDKDSE